MSKDRVEAFSDGVFAVAITLLILGLRVPTISPNSNFAQYSSALAPLIPSAISFALTFLIIASNWMSHHYFFNSLKSTPLALVWINNIFLLLLCFMPFPTVLLGEHLTDQFPIILFCINQLLLALTFFAFRKYASREDLFIDSAAKKSMGPRHTIPAIALYSLTILFSFVNVYLALVCLFLVPLLYFVPNLLRLD
jgi:uncharacterized membrane protein